MTEMAETVQFLLLLCAAAGIPFTAVWWFLHRPWPGDWLVLVVAVVAFLYVPALVAGAFPDWTAPFVLGALLILVKRQVARERAEGDNGPR